MKKLKATVITLFPNIFPGSLNFGILKRVLNKSFQLKILDLKAFSNRVDGRPIGGGCGMIIKANVVIDAISSVYKKKTKIFYMSPVGYKLDNNFIKNFEDEEIIILCGRYEGIDARIMEAYPIIPISIGDYILAGGEVAALVFLESIVRYKLTVPKNTNSINEESFNNNLLEFNQYTKPNVISIKKKQLKVPEVLLTGNSKKINEWKKQNSIELTKKYRPDLIDLT